MNLRHFLTQGLALLLLLGLSVGFSGCKPEEGTETDPAPTNGEADGEGDAGMTEDEKNLDETPGEPGTDTGASTDTDAGNTGESTTPGTTDGGPDAPVEAQTPMDDDPAPTPPLETPPLESGSATDGGNAEATIPSVPEAGSVTEIPPEKVPGTPSTPEAGSSTK